MTFKTIIFFIFVFVSLKVSSQTDTIYLSTTADTVLYSYNFFQPDTTFDVYILKKHPTDTTKLISHFSVKSTKTLKPYTNLSIDTVKKYHLTYDGIRIDPYTSEDFNISVKPKQIKKVDQYTPGKEFKFIYKAVVTVKIKCKNQNIYSKQFEYMFDGNSPKDFNPSKITQILSWKRENKYFISYTIREKQTIKSDGYFSHSTYHYISIL